MMPLVRISVLTLILLFLIGCGMLSSPSPKPEPQSQSSIMGNNMQVKPELAREVKKIAATVKGVEKSTAVVVNKDIAVAVKVTGFQRFRLKSIREEVYDKLNKANEGYKVYVTSDKKLFLQLQQLENSINVKKPAGDLKRKLNNIKEDMKG